MVDDYLDKLNEFAERVAEHVPEVVPEDRWHDGWDGACGSEISDESYMPFVHGWDYTLTWCRIRTWHEICRRGGNLDNLDHPLTDIHPDLISPWIYCRAIGLNVRKP